MSTCLTTVLDGVVDNKDLRKPGELRIAVKEQSNYIASRSWFTLNSRVNQTVTLINDKNGGNYFYTAQGENLGTSFNLSAGGIRTIYCTNGTYEILIPNKYALSQLNFLRVAPQMDIFTVDIDELKYVPTLLTLELSGTTSKGDIKSIATSTTLQSLTMERTNVKGDLEDIKDLEHLWYLRFAYSQNVTGDISVIKHMPALRNVEILGCIGITGELSSFASCKDLRWVATPCVTGMPSFSGDIDAFTGINSIQHLEIRNEPNVEGDISVFNTNTANLSFLNLYGCNVSGNIDDIKDCNRLSVLDLGINKEVTGDLAEFLADKPKLTSLSVTGTGVSGDITSANAPLVNTLDISYTGVSGSIGTVDFEGYSPEGLNPLSAHVASDGFVKHMPSLTTFTVNNSLISGDIDVLANCPSIARINVYNSNITGNVEALSGLSALTYFNIGYTKVYGDIGTGLAGCINLGSIYMESCPYVYGDLSLLGNNMKFISASLSSGPFSWSGTRSSSAYIISMYLVRLGDDLDAMLINQANCQPNNTASSVMANSINVYGNRSSDPQIRAAANAAILTLRNKGYAVTINGALQTEALIGNDAIDFGD